MVWQTSVVLTRLRFGGSGKLPTVLGFPNREQDFFKQGPNQYLSSLRIFDSLGLEATDVVCVSAESKGLQMVVIRDQIDKEYKSQIHSSSKHPSPP